MTQTALLTAEEFQRLYSGREGKYELVRGEVVAMPPIGGEHSEATSNLHFLIKRFLLESNLGWAVFELGFYLARNPDLVRAPDVAFISRQRVGGLHLPPGYFDGPPDLAVEVVSPSDTAPRLQDKVDDYLAAGTRSVWVVYPDRQAVMVYRPDGTARRHDAKATLEEPEILPGFKLPVRAIFE